MKGALLKLEFLRIRRSLAAMAILAFALIASLYSVWSGTAWRDAQVAMLGNYEADVEVQMQTWREDLFAIEQGTQEASPFAARPGNIRVPATQPVGPLGHLAVGSSALLPTRATITPLQTRMSMIEPYEFDNPTTLSLGKFDLAFFTVVVLPLLMIALSFDVLASDRSRGTLKLLLSNPISTENVLVTRLAVRNGLLILLALVSIVVGLATASEGGFGGYGLLWLGTFLAYTLFWLALIYLAVSRIRRSEATAATLIGLWVLFTLAIPALTNSAGEAVYPLPSQLEYLSDSRAAQVDASRRTSELTDDFLQDHPELTVSDESVPDFFSAVFLANEQVLSNTVPIVNAFEEANRQRSAFVDRLQYLSPAIIAQRAFFRIAGSDFDQAQMFITQAGTAMDDLNDVVRPAIISKNRLASDSLGAVPVFSMELAGPGAALRQISFPIIFLLVCAAVLAAVGYARKKDSPL